MFQGTSSNAGKSVLTAGFCRVLLQDGFRPGPFKSQNMSLNSFVTADGREMGRAQATQAQACRLEPDARMNPVLLKPCSDVGSQVLVMGRPVGNMRVQEYVRYKPQAFAAACSAYDGLAAEHDVMVLEGAGSPAEINLKAHDIVNMAMARYARAKVLLVGDIDRGGVFASLVGTMALLDPWERDLVAGFVINRFRGDATLLEPALRDIATLTGKPFLGVVPYLHDLGLPEEDSVSFKEGALKGGAPSLPDVWTWCWWICRMFPISPMWTPCGMSRMSRSAWRGTGAIWMELRRMSLFCPAVKIPSRTSLPCTRTGWAGPHRAPRP